MSRRFANPWPTRPPPGHNNVVRWALAHRVRRPPDTIASVVERSTPSFDTPRAAPDELTVTWLGHSTLLVQIGGWNVLTDPVWAERASPLRFAGPRRRLPPAIALASLPPIDLVVVSHNHYDHLDLGTARYLAHHHPDAHWTTPLGVRRLVERAGARRVSELAWWDAIEVGSLNVTCTPAQHSSGRGMTDRNRSLWCGWSIVADGRVRRAVYFAGDTAYCPAFAEIGERCGAFDACLLPIGAYEPRWYMQYVHMTPEEAVRAFEDLCRGGGGQPVSSTLIPIHWGTFRIADDALDEPPRRLRAAWEHHQLPMESLAVLGHGETRRWPSHAVSESTNSK